MEQRLRNWEEQLGAYTLPGWDSLPELELYMDQVVVLLSRYLAFLDRGEEAAITPSIVNNYVRLKVMPPPVKKRYGRVHIAYLLMICTLKQSLSIATVRKLLPLGLEEGEVREIYRRFTELHAAAAGTFSQYIRTMRDGGCPSEMPATMAVVSALAKSLTDYLLDEEI